MSILDYRIGLSDKTSKGILDSGFNLDGSEMSPEQKQQYEQFKRDNNMSSISVGSQPVAMGMPITMNDAVPLNEQLGYYPNSGIPSLSNTRYDDFNQNRFYGTPVNKIGIMENDLQADNFAPIYEDDLMNYNEFYEMPSEKEDEENSLYANLMEYARNNLPNIVGRGALMQAGIGAGAMLGGLPGVLLGLFAGAKAPFRNTPSMQAWKQLNPTQRSYASDLYRPGNILQGYNPVSAYGLGPIGTLQKRRENILKTINKPGYKGGLGKPGGRLEQIEKAITNTGGGLPGGSGDNRASWSPTADYSPSGLGTSTSLDYDGWED